MSMFFKENFILNQQHLKNLIPTCRCNSEIENSFHLNVTSFSKILKFKITKKCISIICMFQFRLLWINMFAQNNNSLPNIRRNSGDFVDVLHEIAWLSCTCLCFRSLLQNELAGQCIWNIQGAGLVGGNNRAGSASRMSAQSGPLTKSGPLADSERTPSGLGANS